LSAYFEASEVSSGHVRFTPLKADIERQQPLRLLWAQYATSALVGIPSDLSYNRI